MFTAYDKALTALVMAVAFILSSSGVIIPEWLTEGSIGAFFMALSPLFVWLVPNRG